MKEKRSEVESKEKKGENVTLFPLPSRLTEGEVEPFPFPCVLQSRSEIQTEELEHP